MDRGRKSGGYTIIEVMIFLAVSAFMFVVAAYFIQGKQANAEFNQGMQAINSSMQKVINDVNDNNYPPVDLQFEGQTIAQLQQYFELQNY